MNRVAMVRRAALVLLLLVGCRPGTPAAPALEDALGPGRVAPVRQYIAAGWQQLTRSNRDLAVAARDPKFLHAPGTPWPVYLAPTEDLPAIQRRLAEVLTPAQLGAIALRPLQRDVPPGLLYLPEPYVVPGGRFNEMYGWDSYFIVLGLLRDGQVERARQQTDDFLYEVQRYGQVLNANRSYYLTRSQPPLLSGMVRAVYDATGDRTWLARAFPALVATHHFWTTAPHLAGDTGLSRYFDTGAGPAPEVVADERDAQGRTHYDRVRAFYRTHVVTDYDQAAYYDRAHDALTPLFYTGDRSMRESGFDPSNRFGPFGADVIHYAPVCLNVLLAVLEEDLAAVARTLGQPAEEWERRQAERRQRIDRFLWDEGSGLYFDWNFAVGQRRPYPFATTFWPLWAGLASAAQAARVRANLALFERPGGVVTSTRVTGNQWDAPFGWAPLQLFAVRGLLRYHFDPEARRLARAFDSLIVEDFERRRAIVEKYDVVRRSSDVEGEIRFGYAENQIGFGWTNGVFLDLLPVALATD
jgi:alpha,alpha-trehalase